MSQRGWLRFGAACGILFVVLVIVGFAIGVASSPANTIPFGTPEQFASVLADPTPTGVWIGLYVGVLGFLCLPFFAGRLWATLRQAEGDPAWGSLIAFGAALMYVVFSLMAFVARAVTSYRAGPGIEAQSAMLLLDLQTVSYIMSWAVGAVFLGASAMVIVRTRALSRWLGWSAGLIALLWLGATAAPTSEIAQLVGFLPLLWILAASIALLRRTQESRTTAAMPSAPSLAKS